MFSLQDQNILGCLQKAKTVHPHLEELFHLHQQLFHLQFAFKAGLRDRGKGLCPGDKEIDLTRLAEGIPQVTFDELHMEAAPVIDLYRGIEALLIRYAGHLPPGEGEPTLDMIVGYARKIFSSRGPLLVGAGQPEDVIGMASGFVLAPYLQLACELMMPRITQGAWHRGYCPVCGGVPAFAAVRGERSARTLLCSRCNGEWIFRRFGCPFCLERDHQTYYPSDEGGHRLYVCEACHRYLKFLDMRESARESCLPVEALATVSMDIAAREKGCTFY